MEGCVFCKIVKKEIPVKIIYESDNFIAFPDANPKVDGHTLIVSKHHFINSMDMPSIFGSEFFDVVKRIAETKFKEGFEGFNLFQNNFSCAGQEVMHFHIHFFPRKTDDRKKLNII
jgi:histidine triad (HIT) family protein